MAKWEEKMEKDWGATAEKGMFALFMKVFFLIMAMTIVIGIGGYVFGFIGEGAAVVKEEFGPRAALRKYEWFKDASAQLEGKKQTIIVYDNKLKALETSYEGASRREWDRTDKEAMNLWMVEVAGIKASYNRLAAEYNSASSKFNWSYAEGDEPQTYKIYQTQ